MDSNSDVLLKDRYRIIRKLGQGGMGTVFLAHDLSLDHDVAVKANLSPVDEGGNQFLREARLLAALRHPNLPRVTDYFILERTQYLVMDYIPGDDLDTLLKRSGPQPLAKVLAWAQQLGSALTYMHRQTPPVIHRDIKPGNIKLSVDGQAVLVDFGIAKALADQATSTGLQGYTPGFAPPEQYGQGHTGPQTDQYALAATIYMLLSGEKPADSIRRMLGQAVLTPLETVIPGIPMGVQPTLERALAVKQDERFASVDAFVSALTEAANAPLGQARPTAQPKPVDAGSQKTSSTPDQRTMVGGSNQTPMGTPPPGSGFAPPPRRGIPGWVFALLGVAGLGGLAVLALGAYLIFNNRTEAKATATLTPAVAAQAASPTPTTAEVIVDSKPTQTPEPSATSAPQPSATPKPPEPTRTPAAPKASPTSQPTEAAPALGKGGLIAFVSDRADGKTLQIWTMRAWLNDQGKVETGDLRQLTKTEGSKRQPHWSPDGSELLYVAPGGAKGETDIWKIKADGSGDPVNVSNRKGSERDPAWSPDGKKIAFTVDQRGDGVLQLYLMNADGSNQARLSTEQDESMPAWSPKMDWLGCVMNIAGNQIFYLRSSKPADAATPMPPYFITPVPFDRFDLKGSLGQVSDPVWSPDGNWVAYTALRNNNERVQVARFPVKVVDQDIIPLATSGRNMTPAWSPDSQWLAFVSYRDGNPELYVMRATGQTQSRLTDAPGKDLDPSWQVLK